MEENRRIRIEVDEEHFFTYTYSTDDEWYDIITHAFEEALKMYGMDKSVKDESFKFEVFEMEPEEE